LSSQEKSWIGEQIFHNECSAKPECLVWWNVGEDFLSLGIGHFIWYPDRRDGPFEESFPKLLRSLKAQGVLLPEWLAASPDPNCPWKDREEFLRESGGQWATDLREILQNTKAEQTEYMIKRLEDALPLIRKVSPQSRWEELTEKFYQLASIPAGVYALADYVNFKGTGVVTTERYKGQGWGLAQILAEMTIQPDAEDAVREFARIADKLLTQRVANSPPERNEQRWLTGWRRRILSYVEALNSEYHAILASPRVTAAE